MKPEAFWEQPLVSIDVVPFVHNIKKREVQLITARRQHTPFKNVFALPGVLLLANERANHAAQRALTSKLGITNKKISFLKDIGISDNPDRDPRGPSLSIVYLAIIEDTDFTDDSIQTTNVTELDNLELPFDHKRIINKAVEATNSLVLYDKEATQAIVGKEFKTTDMFTVLSSFYNATGGHGITPDQSNLSRRLKSTEWFEKKETEIPVASRTLTSSSKGRPSNLWTFKN